ncbi:hypothetical protein AB1Y20_008566 [Prymnesium parvum]|uniref:Uncharacterized protein n=1 Tax=Prymnesium parvum TaxID=97485 RepID=A0AB34IRH3_PRYPA
MLASLPADVLCNIAREAVLCSTDHSLRHVLRAMTPLVPSDALLLALLEHHGTPLRFVEYVFRRRGRPVDHGNVSMGKIVEALEIVRDTSLEDIECLERLGYQPQPLPDEDTLHRLLRAHLNGDYGHREQYGPLQFWDTSLVPGMSNLFQDALSSDYVI